MATALPRLLYVGDVGVSPTTGGEALLYRLLSGYPPEKLSIVEGNTATIITPPHLRLPKVSYRVLNVGYRRLLYTRLNPYYAATLALAARARWCRLMPLAREFRPDVIVTVAHGFSWLSAAELARRLQLPLHLIVHDEWLVTLRLPSPLKAWARRALRQAYRDATGRWCVSPYVAQSYQEDYGVPGQILYPSRSADSHSFCQPAEQVASSAATLVLGFAGSLHYIGYAEGIRRLADALEPVGGRVVVYSTMSNDDRRKHNLNRENIDVRPFRSSNELIDALRRECTALFVPMSFHESQKQAMQIGFPSKLADYTATGLPLLIWGPPYSSVVRWAHENKDSAEIVEHDDLDSLNFAIGRLMDANHRSALARNAIEVGRRYFDHKSTQQMFWQALLASSGQREHR